MLTDENLLSASSAILQAPLNVLKLNEQKDQAVAGKSKAKSDDDTNKIFYDNEKSYIKSYFDELKALNGTIHTEYSDTDLDNGGRLAPGNLHFPAPGWVKFPPKLLISNNGNPTSGVFDFEAARISTSQGAVTFLKLGFNDGSLTQTLVNPHSIGGTIDTDMAFNIGDRIVAIDGSNVVYGKVQTATLIPAVLLPLPLPAYYEHVLTFYMDSALTDSGEAANFSDGWTDNERKGLSNPLDYDFMIASEASLDAEILALKGFLDTEITALTGNSSTGTEATDIQTAKTAAQNLRTTLVNWSALPPTGITTRFSDTNLNNLNSAISARDTTARIAQINTALGNVTQNSEGAFTGSGHYFSLFKWVDLRINIAYGTLRNYYNFDLIISFIDQKIIGEGNKNTEYSKIMLVKRVTSEITGNDELTLDSVTDLSVSDSIKILDEDSPSLVATILNITGNVVQLSLNIPVSYSVDKQARLIKEL